MPAYYLYLDDIRCFDILVYCSMPLNKNIHINIYLTHYILPNYFYFYYYIIVQLLFVFKNEMLKICFSQIYNFNIVF